MDLYLDSVDFKEIEAALDFGFVKGLTTTPTFMHRHGITEEQAYLDLRTESRRLQRPMRELAEALVLAEELHRKGEKKDLV